MLFIFLGRPLEELLKARLHVLKRNRYNGNLEEWLFRQRENRSARGMEDAKEKNKPFPSSPENNEVKCSAFDMEMIFHSHANKTHFHKTGCALDLILKVRVLGTRKWPISLAYSAGNSDYTDRGEFEDEKRKKNVSPFSPHSPTRSLKQDSKACGGGYNQLKLYSRMAFPRDRRQTWATWTVLSSIFVRFLFSFFLMSTMRMSVFCPLNKHFSWQGFEFPL